MLILTTAHILTCKRKLSKEFPEEMGKFPNCYVPYFDETKYIFLIKMIFYLAGHKASLEIFIN